MKYSKPVSLLAVALFVFLFSACKKDDKPDPGTDIPHDPEPVALLTKATYLNQLKDTIGSTWRYEDTLYYDASKQLRKIVTSSFDKITGSVSSFTYNNDGTLASMRQVWMFSPDLYQDYRFTVPMEPLITTAQ